jgi:hypothetical protein
MPFDIAGFLVGRTLGTHQGISDTAVLNRLALVGGVMGTSPTGVVLMNLIAQREAGDIAPPPPSPTAPPTQAIQVEVPDITDMHFREATRKLEQLGLTALRRDLYSTTSKDTVVGQDPVAKTIVPQGAQITILVSLGAEIPSQCPTPQKEKDKEKVGAAAGGNTSTQKNP